MARPGEFVGPVIVAGVAAGIVLGLRLGMSAFGPRLLVNVTPSEPVGVYRVLPHRASEYVRGMRVVLPVPSGFEGFVIERGWLAPGVPLVKEIGAVAKDRVCIGSDRALVNDRTLGPVWTVDSRGRALPTLRGCFVVPDGAFFPVSTRIPNSFDGRYFGVQPVSSIVGEARALWIF